MGNDPRLKAGNLLSVDTRVEILASFEGTAYR